MASFGAALWIALAAAPSVSAQAGIEERLRITEQEKQQRFEAASRVAAAGEYLELPRREYVAFDTGGWLTLNYFNFKDSDNDTRTPDALKGLILQDLRTWFNIIWPNDISLYTRLKKLRFDFQRDNASITLPDVDILEEPDLDLMFLTVPWKKTRIQLGRQYLQTGRGLAFSGVLDALYVNWVNAGLSVDGFFGTTPYKTHNNDRSITGFDLGTNNRDFFDLEVAYQWPSNHRLHAFYLTQRDNSSSFSAVQDRFDFSYDSDYYGIGASGPVSSRVVYYAESIWQDGETLSSTSTDPTASNPAARRDDIEAYSFRGGVNYFVPDAKHTVLSAEFAFGSGDGDRGDVVTTFPGNRPGTKDKNFNYFGFYDGGLALSPRLSNLAVWRLGHSFKPFKSGRKTKEIQLASILSFYRKDEPGVDAASSVFGAFANPLLDPAPSAISDPQSNLFGESVGIGIDSFISARIFSEMTMVARYGLFIPGDTYTPSFVDGQGITRHGGDNASQFSLTMTASF